MTFRQIMTDAIRYWETRRLLYNLVLVVIVMCHAVGAILAGQDLHILATLLGLFVLATIANVLYCAAYVPDVLVQFSDFRETWLMIRWVLLLIGTITAGICAHLMCYGFFLDL